MKAIFLDIDGVLNTSSFDFSLPGHPLSPSAIERINMLAARTGAAVVLTTSWREMFPWPECANILREHGMTADVVGETRVLANSTDSLGPVRRREIEDYVQRESISQYVVIDDQLVYPDGHPKFVRTDEAEGFTQAELERAIAILGDGEAETRDIN